MLRAHELDSKFSRSYVDVKGLSYYKRIQEEVKQNTDHFEKGETDMLFDMTDYFLVKESSEEKKKNQEIINDRQKFITILQTVSDQTGVQVERIKEHSRFRELTIPRHMVIFLTRWSTELSMDDIGRAVINGVKLNHTTIINACKKIVEIIKLRDEKLFPMLQRIIYALRGEGIYINLKCEQPSWFLKMMNGIETIKFDENKTLVTG